MQHGESKSWRSRLKFKAADVADQSELVVPTDSLLTDYQGPLLRKVAPGKAVSMITDQKVFFKSRGRSLVASWHEFHDIGQCEEVRD